MKFPQPAGLIMKAAPAWQYELHCDHLRWMPIHYHSVSVLIPQHSSSTVSATVSMNKIAMADS